MAQIVDYKLRETKIQLARLALMSEMMPVLTDTHKGKAVMFAKVGSSPIFIPNGDMTRAEFKINIRNFCEMHGLDVEAVLAGYDEPKLTLADFKKFDLTAVDVCERVAEQIVAKRSSDGFKFYTDPKKYREEVVDVDVSNMSYGDPSTLEERITFIKTKMLPSFIRNTKDACFEEEDLKMVQNLVIHDITRIEDRRALLQSGVLKKEEDNVK